MLIFGDSLTEGWDATVWERSLAPRGALNAGVSGDRTDHLLWRLQHGNLAGPIGVRFPIAFTGRKIDIEQMNLVVTRCDPPVWPDQI